MKDKRRVHVATNTRIPSTSTFIDPSSSSSIVFGIDLNKQVMTVITVFGVIRGDTLRDL